MRKERKKYQLSLVMDANRSDVDFLGHETKEDGLGHLNITLTRTERDEFLKHNNLTIVPTVDEQMDNVISHILRGDTVYGQAWNSEGHKQAWITQYADAW